MCKIAGPLLRWLNQVKSVVPSFSGRSAGVGVLFRLVDMHTPCCTYGVLTATKHAKCGSVPDLAPCMRLHCETLSAAANQTPLDAAVRQALVPFGLASRVPCRGRVYESFAFEQADTQAGSHPGRAPPSGVCLIVPCARQRACKPTEAATEAELST